MSFSIPAWLSPFGTKRTNRAGRLTSGDGGRPEVAGRYPKRRECEGLRMAAPWWWRGARRGPAYANLQWRKPREVWRGGASVAMGIWTLAACCRGALTTSVGSGRRGGELGRSIAIAGTGVAQRRLIDESVTRGVATASMVMADRESARQRRNGMPWRTGSGHDVSILITAGR